MGKPEAPVDDLTGYPLPFAPRPDLPLVPEFGDTEYDRNIANYHHPIHRRREIEGYGDGGAAARDSRIQWSLRDDHDAFHAKWGGLDVHMPRTPGDQYQTALIGAMRYIPLKVIRFDQGEPYVDWATGTERERLRTSGEIRVGNDGVRVRKFMLSHTVNNGIERDDDLIDQFLWLAERPNVKPGRLLATADTLLCQAIEPTLPLSMAEIYRHAKRAHLLRPRLPRSLGAFIRREIIFGSTGPRDFVRMMLDQCVSFRQGAIVPVRA